MIAARFRHTEEQHTHFLYDNWQLAGRVNRDVVKSIVHRKCDYKGGASSSAQSTDKNSEVM